MPPPKPHRCGLPSSCVLSGRYHRGVDGELGSVEEGRTVHDDLQPPCICRIASFNVEVSYNGSAMWFHFSITIHPIFPAFRDSFAMTSRHCQNMFKRQRDLSHPSNCSSSEPENPQLRKADLREDLQAKKAYSLTSFNFFTATCAFCRNGSHNETKGISLNSMSPNCVSSFTSTFSSTILLILECFA